MLKLRMWDKGVVMRGALAGESRAVSKGLKATKHTDVQPKTVSFVAFSGAKFRKGQPNEAYRPGRFRPGPKVAKSPTAHGRKIAKVARRRDVSRGGGAILQRVKEPAAGGWHGGIM